MGRKIVALVAGVLVLGLVVMTLQQVSSAIHPLPEGLDPFDPGDAEAFAEHLASMPPGAWAVAFLSELLGAFFGGMAAGWIARDRARLFSGIIVGLAFVASTSNWLAFDHPLWFIAGQLVGYPLVLTAAWFLLESHHGPRDESPDGGSRGAASPPP